MVWLGPNTEPQRLLSRLEASFPTHVLLEDQSGLPDLGRTAVRLIACFLQLGSPGEVEDADRLIRATEGVVEVEAYSPRGIYGYDDRFSERLGSRVGQA